MLNLRTKRLILNFVILIFIILAGYGFNTRRPNLIMLSFGVSMVLAVFGEDIIRWFNV